MPGLPYVKGRRLRVFGGPNGSGKTTIIELIKSSFDVGFYINADDIEKELKTSGEFDLQALGIDKKLLTESAFDDFVTSHSITLKAQQRGFTIDLKLDAHKIQVKSQGRLSYEAALIAEYLRQILINTGKKITFETVMSHPSKIDIIKWANERNYKTYLYFICTSSHDINIERVNLRVKKGGHAVQKDLIEKRYYKSLNLLKDAVSQTYRSFIWDNSGKRPELILEVFEGKEVLTKTTSIPNWVDEYLLSK